MNQRSPTFATILISFLLIASVCLYGNQLLGPVYGAICGLLSILLLVFLNTRKSTSGKVFATILVLVGFAMMTWPASFNGSMAWQISKHATKSAIKAEVEPILASDRAFRQLTLKITHRKMTWATISGIMPGRHSFVRLSEKLRSCRTLRDHGFTFDIGFADQTEPIAESIAPLGDLPSISAVTLRVSDLAASQNFFSQLGVVLDLEHRDNGQGFLSGRLGDCVLELHLATEANPVTSSAQLGFAAPPGVNVAKLRELGIDVSVEESSFDLRRRVVVTDPDGHRILLF